MLQEKGVNQWSIWLKPDADKINWITAGFIAGEFYFVETESGDFAGMFRLMQQDNLYWGKQETAARYIHSLVVAAKYKGQHTGKLILQKIEQQVINEGIDLLRLDCIASNTRLCNYYESLGFIKKGEKQMPHSMNNLYQKKLNKT